MSTWAYFVMFAAGLAALVSPGAVAAYTGIQHLKLTKNAAANKAAQDVLTVFDRELEMALHATLAALPGGPTTTWASVKSLLLDNLGVIGKDALASIRAYKGSGFNAWLDAAATKILSDIGLPGQPEPSKQAVVVRRALANAQMAVYAKPVSLDRPTELPAAVPSGAALAPAGGRS